MKFLRTHQIIVDLFFYCFFYSLIPFSLSPSKKRIGRCIHAQMLVSCAVIHNTTAHLCTSFEGVWGRSVMLLALLSACAPEVPTWSGRRSGTALGSVPPRSSSSPPRSTPAWGYTQRISGSKRRRRQGTAQAAAETASGAVAGRLTTAHCSSLQLSAFLCVCLQLIGFKVQV